MQIDLHKITKEQESDHYWKNYRTYDGKNIPAKNDTFDIAIICDVLHHDLNNASLLIQEAKRTSKYILIKDHFEYGIFSRSVLRLMDFVGNWGYDVSIPKKYFSKETFQSILKENRLVVIESIDSINLYNHLPLIRYLLKPHWQFIKVLKSI